MLLQNRKIQIRIIKLVFVLIITALAEIAVFDLFSDKPILMVKLLGIIGVVMISYITYSAYKIWELYNNSYDDDQTQQKRT